MLPGFRNAQHASQQYLKRAQKRPEPDDMQLIQDDADSCHKSCSSILGHPNQDDRLIHQHPLKLSCLYKVNPKWLGILGWALGLEVQNLCSTVTGSRYSKRSQAALT